MIFYSFDVVTYFIHYIALVYAIYCVLYATITVVPGVQFHCEFLKLFFLKQPMPFRLLQALYALYSIRIIREKLVA